MRVDPELHFSPTTNVDAENVQSMKLRTCLSHYFCSSIFSLANRKKTEIGSTYGKGKGIHNMG
jgi:hypothetical protein